MPNRVRADWRLPMLSGRFALADWILPPPSLAQIAGSAARRVLRKAGLGTNGGRVGKVHLRLT